MHGHEPPLLAISMSVLPCCSRAVALSTDPLSWRDRQGWCRGCYHDLFGRLLNVGYILQEAENVCQHLFIDTGNFFL